MRLFKVTAKNCHHWDADGALDATFYVLAPDFMSALVKADELVGELRGKLRDHKSAEELRVRDLSEVGEIVDGVVFEREIQTESWAERAVRRATKQS